MFTGTRMRTLECDYYRRGQHFTVDSVSPISFVLHLKLPSTVILKELYSIGKCVICLDTFLRFIADSVQDYKD